MNFDGPLKLLEVKIKPITYCNRFRIRRVVIFFCSFFILFVTIIVLFFILIQANVFFYFACIAAGYEK